MTNQNPKNPLPEFFVLSPVGETPSTVRDVWIVQRKLTEEQARSAYPNRPYSEDIESRWGGVAAKIDDLTLIANGWGGRCTMCTAATQNKYLVQGVCPDCDGRAECQGLNPHLRTKP